MSGVSAQSSGAGPRQVLIIKPSAIGDVVHALPILPRLRKLWPQAKLSWLVTPGCAALVERHLLHIRHVHVNELDGRHCGSGSYDYKPLLRALRRGNYAGWISLEAFDFTPGAERLAAESLRHLESEIAGLS